MLEQAPVALALLSGPELRFEFFNSRYRKLTGSRSLAGLTVREAFPELQGLGFDELLEQVYRSGHPHLQKAAKIGRKGQETYLDLSYLPLYGEEASIQGVMVVAQEVTTRVTFSDIREIQLTERALRESEAGLAIALDVSGVGFWSYDPSSGRVRVSQQFCKDWGLDQATFDYPVEAALACIHPHDKLEVEAALKDALGRNQPYLVEYRVVHGVTGEIVWIEARGRTIHNDQGEANGLVGTSQNITQRKQAVQQLQESRDQLRRLADSMPQIVWTARPDGELDYTNQRWTEYSGSTDPASWLAHVHPEDQPRALERWTECVLSGQTYETEFRLLRQGDLSYRWHLVRAEAVRERGEITAWYGTCTDLHEQKKLTQELEEARRLAEHASLTKSAFLANMSHEIRTPLAAILGYTQILKDDSLKPEDRLEFLEVISRNGNALTRLIDDILDLSKVEAGQIEPESMDFHLPELLAEVQGLFEEQARTKNLRFELNYSPDLPARVCSDPTRIRQILNNLIGNALKFTAQGSVLVSVEFRPPHLQFTICDSGIGLAEEQAARLFTPFSQGDNSTTRRFGGTGLGLALSRRLARALGGDVWLDPDRSRPGCTFLATVEARPAQADDLVPVMPGAARKLDGMRVLLVEDLADNQRLITHYLERAGARLELAQDGQEGVEKALAGDFQVVLMDMQMPKLDGYTATRLLREQGYQRPVVALTAHAMLEERERILNSGCDAHLTKPLDFDLLMATLLRLA